MDHAALTPLGLFLGAGLVGRAVMLALLAASVWTWVLIAEGAWSARRLGRAVREVRAAEYGDAPGAGAGVLAPVLEQGRVAAALAIPGEGVGELRGRIVEAMNRVARNLLTKAGRGLPNLAIVASVAPFVGLFGTVWGIMGSFASIAAAKDTSLAVVAPGIAEALAATAIGLAAAIPASVGYNRIGASLSRAGADLGDLAEEEAVALAARARRAGPAADALADPSRTPLAEAA